MAASAAAATSSATTITSSSSTLPKKCFNPDCTDFKSRQGWRLRSGDFADLCDRCASTYEEGRFCELFHLNASGWRCCESCGKQVHCGCIVSLHAFILLDAGGIECMACARKSIVFTSASARPSSLFSHPSFSERHRDPLNKVRNQLAESGPLQWCQEPNLFNSSIHQSELSPRVLYEVDRLNSAVPALSLGKGKKEDFSDRLNGSPKLGVQDISETENAGVNEVGQPGSHLNVSCQSSSLRNDLCSQQFGVATPLANGTNGQIGGSGTFLQPTPSPQLPMHFHDHINNSTDLSVKNNCNARLRADARGRSQLLPRYWPRFSGEELHQVSGNSNSVIKPLFEKMLSASDAGRIGRLVLPKKCAEAYFPPISQPEGLPLKVQDSKGKEWIFQFRFWPNNNSRMYVLEGVTPCIQSMQLQAGDIVTFSRLEPEGKLVMGYRKASTAPPSDQENETRTRQSGKRVSTNGYAELPDASPWSKVDKSGYIAKEFVEGKSLKKRKSTILGSKSKCPRIENEDMIELKITWEEAQGLLRAPPGPVPSIVVIEGIEFEEHEDAPVLGKPTIFSTDNTGKKIQWVQCEDCLKWRKVPAHALLASRWTCSCNSWDPERSLCSVAQQLAVEQLEDLLTAINLDSKKMKEVKHDTANDEAEGLDTLADLAILGESLQTSAQETTKHPRHRPGCSCIVCIQPPSGKGPKHKQTCTCNVCETVKRRFRTLMMKREKRLTEKGSDAIKKQQQLSSEKLLDDGPSPSSNTGSSSPNKMKVVSEGSDDELSRVKSSASLFKGQFDLNMQPEREDELSPGSDFGSVKRVLQDASKILLKQPEFLNSDGDGYSTGNQALGENIGNCIKHEDKHQDAAKDLAAVFPNKSSASTTATSG